MIVVIKREVESGLPDTGAASSLRVFQRCIFGREGDQWRCRLRYLWLIRSQQKASCEPGIRVNISQVIIKLFLFLFIEIVHALGLEDTMTVHQILPFPPGLTSVRDLRKLALCLRGSWTRPSQNETMP